MIPITYEEYREAWRLNPKNHKIERMPLHLDIELNTDCNLKCDMCPNHSPKARYPPEAEIQMDWDIYKKIIDEAAEKGVCAIKLCFRGEPLLYDMLPEAVYYARDNRIMEIIVDSNGLLLTSVIIIRLMLSGLNIFILSDYGYEKQVENAKLILKMKELLHFDIPKLIVKTNTPEKWEGIADEILPVIIHDYNSGEECLEESDFECEQLYQRLVILADGRVKVCCSSVMFEDTIIGDVHDDTIEDLWNGEYMSYFRFYHKNHKAILLESCRHCPAVIEFVSKKKVIKQ